MPILYHQLLLNITGYQPQSIVVGFDSNEFHEFWGSHLFCTNIQIYIKEKYVK